MRNSGSPSDQFKLDWIIEYIKENKRANIMDAEFVDAFVNKFNAKSTIMMYGANKCPELGRLLSMGYKKDIFKRFPVGLSNGAWHDGFPKWVYVYELK